jgi:hypothetical protein
VRCSSQAKLVALRHLPGPLARPVAGRRRGFRPIELQRSTSWHLDIIMLRCYLHAMRTTLHIDDDVYRAAKSLAEAEDKPVGKVLSDLARKGLTPRKLATKAGFPVFSVPAGAPPITLEMVQAALDDEGG